MSGFVSLQVQLLGFPACSMPPTPCRTYVNVDFKVRLLTFEADRRCLILFFDPCTTDSNIGNSLTRAKNLRNENELLGGRSGSPVQNSMEPPKPWQYAASSRKYVPASRSLLSRHPADPHPPALIRIEKLSGSLWGLDPGFPSFILAVICDSMSFL